ncbi:MAG: acyl-CoA dehydrogenase family protein [Candidatus Binataceae bacterium]
MSNSISPESGNQKTKTTSPTETAARQNLVEAAKRIGPSLRARSDEINQLRRLPDGVWRDLVETGLLRALQPSRWGGVEAGLDEFYAAVAEVARAEGSTGWALGIVGVHPWQTALYPRQLQEEIWGDDPTIFNSSSYAPTGKAEKAPGGWRLDGRWSFSTGCDHCQWVNLGAIPGMTTVEGLEVPDFRSFILPRKDYRIDDNWFVSGLAGSGSKDIVVDNAFVPEYRSQSHWDYTRGVPLPGWEINPSPLYKLPWAVVFNLALAAATLGAAQGFLEEWINASRTRIGGLGLKVSEDPYTYKLLAEASYTIDSGLLTLIRDAGAMMETVRAGEAIPYKRRAAIRYNACRAAQLAARAVDDLYESSSGRIIFFGHPLHRRYQDVKAMLGHAYLNVDNPARMYGAMELGNRVVEFFL